VNIEEGSRTEDNAEGTPFFSRIQRELLVML